MQHVCGFGVGVVERAFFAGAAEVPMELFAEFADGGADVFQARFGGGLIWA